MFDYLEKFNNLDPKIKEKVSNPFILGVVDSLENKYNVDLAAIIMRIMIKAIPINDLAIHLADEFSLAQEPAQKLSQELKEKVFLGVADYLGLDLSQLFVAPVQSVSAESSAIANPYDQEIEAAIRAAIVEMNLNLSPESGEKLVATTKLYWREVRSKIDTRSVLVKPTTDAGFSLSEAAADGFLKSIDTKKAAMISRKQASIKKPESGVLAKLGELAKSATRNESDYNLASLLDTKHEIKGGLDLKHEIAPVKPVVPTVPVAPAAPIAPSIPVPPVVVKAAPVVVPPVVRPVVPVKPAENKVKPRLEDIKPIRIMNPIDELRYMDLVNFRRMAKDPNDITKKIKSRIKLLEGEDYEKGLAAVTAWRQSPVNKTYLKIINNSMSQGVPIKQVITALMNQKQDYLTPEEVEAIITLNSELKF